MAKTKLPNLGTKRDTDHDLSPHELPTNHTAGEKPPYTVQEGPAHQNQTWHESEMRGLGLDTVDRSGSPDPHELEADIAHSNTPLSVQSRAAVRKNFGGGAGEQLKVSNRKRGGLQDTGDRPADRVGPKRRP
ncbi:MAG TPA: hypothetical protein VN087_02650 [Verrucomicrobiae bacterium]|jgi:hypothetical protein|nr:hypothetical protein [Verrucomicrobiae bacterium]